MIGIQAMTGYSPKHLQRDPESRELFWRDQADVSPEFAEVLDRLVRYDVNERYGCAEDVLESLNQVMSDGFRVSLTPIDQPIPALCSTATCREGVATCTAPTPNGMDSNLDLIIPKR